MRILRNSAIAIALSLMPFVATAQGSPTPTKSDPLHAWVQANDPAKLEAWVNERLDTEKALIAKLLAVKEAHTVENTLRPYDEANNQLAIAGNNSYLLYSARGRRSHARQGTGHDGKGLYCRHRIKPQSGSL